MDDYWDNYYSKKRSSRSESGFARFVAEKYREKKIIADIGCGDGRDSIFFASLGRQVIGIDASSEAIKICEKKSKTSGIKCDFYVADLKNQNIFDLICAKNKFYSDLILYARFFIHAIDDYTQDKLFLDSLDAIKGGSLLCLEFRTTEDEHLFKEEDDHYRRYIDVNRVVERCCELGMAVDFLFVGKGLAPYGAEDPVVARLILKRK